MTFENTYRGCGSDLLGQTDLSTGRTAATDGGQPCTHQGGKAYTKTKPKAKDFDLKTKCSYHCRSYNTINQNTE